MKRPISSVLVDFIAECDDLGFDVTGIAFREGDKVIQALRLDTFDNEGKEVTPKFMGVEIREEL